MQVSRAKKDDLREGFPVSRDNFVKYINSFAPCCKSRPNAKLGCLGLMF